MKRIISLLLVIAMILGCTCTSMAATTKSVNYNHNYFDKCTQKKFVGLILNGEPVVRTNSNITAHKGIIDAETQWNILNIKGSYCVNHYEIMPILNQLGDAVSLYTPGDEPDAWEYYGTGGSGGYEVSIDYNFTLFGKHWSWYKQPMKRADGFMEEKIGWINLDTKERYEWPHPYTFNESITDKIMKTYPRNQPAEFVYIAPIFRHLGYNVTWSKEFNSICITSPEYKGPATPEITAEEKKILDWAVETGYVLPDANGNVDYSAPITDRYLYKWIANTYGIDRIKEKVRDLLAKRDHTLPLSMHLDLYGEKSHAQVYWGIVYGDQYVDGFTLRYQIPGGESTYEKKYPDIPEYWPEDELGTKYIFVWLMTYQGDSLLRGDRWRDALGNIFGDGYYNWRYYSGKKAGLDELGICSQTIDAKDLCGFVLSTMDFVDEKRAVDFYNFWNRYQQPKFFELCKKYNPGDWSTGYKTAPYEINEYLVWDPLANWFFKGTDWQKQTRWYGHGGDDRSQEYMLTILDWAKIAYGWYHIDYVSDYTQWDSNIQKYLEPVVSSMVPVGQRRAAAAAKFLKEKWDNK